MGLPFPCSCRTGLLMDAGIDPDIDPDIGPDIWPPTALGYLNGPAKF